MQSVADRKGTSVACEASDEAQCNAKLVPETMDSFTGAWKCEHGKFEEDTRDVGTR